MENLGLSRRMLLDQDEKGASVVLIDGDLNLAVADATDCHPNLRMFEKRSFGMTCATVEPAGGASLKREVRQCCICRWRRIDLPHTHKSAASRGLNVHLE